VLTVSGALYRAIASVSASTQKSGVIVFEIRNESTLRLATSRSSLAAQAGEFPERAF
jgi:hypothetical protein